MFMCIVVLMSVFFFFFSSRRRHTRFDCDWSSDVCSSDLQWNRVADEHGFIVVYPSGEGGGGPRVWHEGGEAGPSRDVRFISELIDTLEAAYNIDPGMIYANEIGRASCRERV